MCIHQEEYKECLWCYGNGYYEDWRERWPCGSCNGTGCYSNCEDCDEVEEDD